MLLEGGDKLSEVKSLPNINNFIFHGISSNSTANVYDIQSRLPCGDYRQRNINVYDRDLEDFTLLNHC